MERTLISSNSLHEPSKQPKKIKIKVNKSNGIGINHPSHPIPVQTCNPRPYAIYVKVQCSIQETRPPVKNHNIITPQQNHSSTRNPLINSLLRTRHPRTTKYQALQLPRTKRTPPPTRPLTSAILDRVSLPFFLGAVRRRSLLLS